MHPKQGRWERAQRGRTTTERGYGHDWEKQKKRVKARDLGLCQECKRQGRTTAGAEVDHIKPKAHGGYAGFDKDDNTEYLCVSCHAAKTKREGNRAKRI